MAETLQETWMRLYGIVMITRKESNGTGIWLVAGTANLETEWYSKRAMTDTWYGPRTPWNIKIDSYDGRDIQRYRGQNTPQRQQDIVNSPKWRGFVTKGWPKGLEDLEENNQWRMQQKFADDVHRSLSAATKVIQLAIENKLVIEDKHLKSRRRRLTKH